MRRCHFTKAANSSVFLCDRVCGRDRAFSKLEAGTAGRSAGPTAVMLKLRPRSRLQSTKYKPLLAASARSLLQVMRRCHFTKAANSSVFLCDRVCGRDRAFSKLEAGTAGRSAGPTAVMLKLRPRSRLQSTKYTPLLAASARSLL